jgi:hypothetical protein
VDQVIARQIGVDTQLASMELGVDPPELAFGAVDGLAGYYTSTISWRGPTTPLPRAVNPRRVFERLFGDTDTLDPVAMRGRIGKMQSVREGDNTLLDNSIIVAGSAHSDANLHTHTNVPILVFGKAQNKIRGGQHIQYKGDAVSDLHMAVMDIANVSPDEYLAGESDASGILKGVRVA